MKASYNKYNTCPLCGNENVDYDQENCEGDFRDRHYYCKDCGAYWWQTEAYTFDSISDIHDKDGNKYENPQIEKED